MVSAPTVGRLLKANGFSFQANAKPLEGEQHPDRDAQFRYINEQARLHQVAGEPVISVDTKKREQLGQLPMTGREWRPKGNPIAVSDHSFFTCPTTEQAIPYGIYDIARNTGWVNVGVDHDTSVFAAESIRRWWIARGRLDYPDASRLLITADAGGSNGHRYRVWKSELAALAADTGLAITVCHFPPGTSKCDADTAAAYVAGTQDDPEARSQLRLRLHRIDSALAHQIDEAAAGLTQQPAGYLIGLLGNPPTDPGAARDWRRRAVAVEHYRHHELGLPYGTPAADASASAVHQAIGAAPPTGAQRAGYDQLRDTQPVFDLGAAL